ncbi:MAG: metallophosphoesterase [Campylobacterota bacterium]|nr:metallophosphoesterase [Campylobacterota bacterium]
MFHSDIEIKEGAFVVSDAHYSHFRPQLLDFIKEIHSKKLQPTQLIFMGDIFDILFSQIPHSKKINEEVIKLINEISQDIELIYLEGNHDFNLKDIFPHAKVFPISKQPLACGFGGKKIILAHGDFGSDIGYQIYTAVIRNPLTLYFLRVVDFILGHLILRKLDDYLSKKNDCREFVAFREFVSKRLEARFDCDYFIEGHFHQNKTLKFDKFIYINLGVFACNQRYFVVKSSQNIKLLEEKIFSKEV